MNDDTTQDYSIKRLRDLCLNIHQENMAFLLKAALPDFPIPVVDEFFLGPKLNKPSGPDDREWTDLVRLMFIAFAPTGSEPARLRGKPIARYKRAYPFDPNRPDSDVPGKLSLYQTVHTTPLLGSIVAGLGVTSLLIQDDEWMKCYLSAPFELKELTVWTVGTAELTDLSKLLSILPATLEILDLPLGLPLGVDDLKRFKSLRSVKLSPESLPNGLDLSENTALEKVSLDFKNGGDGVLGGLSSLGSLAELRVTCMNGTISMEPIDSLLLQKLGNVTLSGIHYLSERFSGPLPSQCTLSGVSGLKEIRLTPGSVDHDDLWRPIEISGANDLLSVSLEGSLSKVRLGNCPKISKLSARLTSDRAGDLQITSCPQLAQADVVFANEADEIVLDDLPALMEITLTSPKVSEGTRGSGDSVFGDSRAKLFLRKTGLIHSPVFKGEWKGLSIIELEDHPKLESLEGIEALPDLTEVRISRLPSMKGIMPSGSPVTLPKVTWLRANHVTLPAPAGFEAMPALTKLDLISSSLGGLQGVESLQGLSMVDLSNSSLGSLAPLASLPVLRSVRISGCSGLKPKPPHVLLEGPELLNELARAAGPNHPIAKNVPSEELSKLIQLIGEGRRSDVSQAMQLLPALSPEEQAKLLTGAAIDPKTGWIRLPYLSKIKDENARGIPQLRILQGVGGSKAEEILNSVTSIIINDGDGKRDSTGTLRFGNNPEYGNDDGILEEFNSIRSLPDLPNLTMISINRVSQFSVEGIEKFPKLTSLILDNVGRLESVESLKKPGRLKRLTLSGIKMDDISGLGMHPDLETLLIIDTQLQSLRGLGNFPALKSFIMTHSCDDITELLTYASNRGCQVSCSSWMDSSYLGNVIGFSFTPAK